MTEQEIAEHESYRTEHGDVLPTVATLVAEIRRLQKENAELREYVGFVTAHIKAEAMQQPGLIGAESVVAAEYETDPEITVGLIAKRLAQGIVWRDDAYFLLRHVAFLKGKLAEQEVQSDS
jgi:hypothetical protein